MVLNINCGRLLSHWLGVAVILFFVFWLTAVTPAQKAASPVRNSRSTDQATAEGRQIFEMRCTGCHGLDGHGGERAPDIVTAQKPQRRSDAELAQIIANGLPAAGMPAFSMLASSRVKSLVAYLRLLQGKTKNDSVALSGNPQNGKALFSGKARCSECHLVQGAGGFIASDLSGFGHDHSGEEIRTAILKPDRFSRRNVAAVVTTHDGQKYLGIVRNEDNFSLQLQTLNGAFHLFMKEELASVVLQPDSLMPSDYGSTLSSGELDDLISFLIFVANDGKSKVASSKKSQQDQDE